MVLLDGDGEQVREAVGYVAQATSTEIIGLEAQVLAAYTGMLCFCSCLIVLIKDLTGAS
jgi:hypothetical protein